MIDDPLALIVQAVFVLAAGMYPVGFMFGVCSDCCGCPPCGRCTHATNMSLPVSLSYGGQTINNPGEEPSSGCGDNSINLSVNDMPAATCQNNGNTLTFVNSLFSGTPCVRALYLIRSESSDECGCGIIAYELGLRARFSIQDSDEAAQFDAPSIGSINACSETEIAFGPFVFVDSESGLSDDCISLVTDYLNSLQLTATLNFDPCDCGACCDEGCEDDVAEGGCSNWAGVGTACDDDPSPCEE